MVLVFLFWVAVLGIITGLIARSKGRSFLGWAIFGAMIFILALPCVLLVSSKRNRCGYCDETISKRASICPHCRSALA